MKILVIDNDYPNEQNLYGDVFVHVRVKEYQKLHDCIVVSLTASQDFFYQGVSVKACSTTTEANTFINNYNPDVILIHFALKEVIDKIIPYHKVSYIIWVHGYEALAWYRRMFNVTIKDFLPHRFFSMVKSNMIQLFSFSKLISHSNRKNKIFFVFVSNWMKKVCEVDTFSKVKNARIIANPINDSVFYYSPKNIEKRKRILMIRPFSSRKYATDIAIAAILKVAYTTVFSDMHFTIIGRGQFFEKQTQPLRKFKNITIKETFLQQNEIKTYHEDHGIFLCPTRQDAQGVSMCEAMSSGLVPITSNNTAIPEFVQDGFSGFLTKNSKEVAEKIVFLYNNPSIFSQISQNTSKSINEKCNIKHIVEEEMELVQQQVDSYK